MKITSILPLIIIAICLSLCAACSDSDIDPAGEPAAEIECDSYSVRLPLRASYHTVRVSCSEGDVGGLPAEASASWIRLTADTVGSDGLVEILADRNEEIAGRTAQLLIGSGARKVTVEIYQCGLGDSDNNGISGCYAGCGYNIFQELNSESSLCNPVIDYARARAYDPLLVEIFPRREQQVKTITSNSLMEMSQLMTTMQEKTRTGISGGKKTVSRFAEQSGTTKMDETGYAYINLQRVVAASAFDLSKATMCMEQGRREIFTEEFIRRYDAVITEPTHKNVEALFREFGTHVITYVELGGSMDVALNFNRTMKGELNMRAEDFSKYFFQAEPSDYTQNGKVQGLTTDLTRQGSFKIAGGSRQSREALVREASASGRLSPSKIQTWQTSLPQAGFESEEVMASLAPLNVQVVPIWLLFPQRLAGLFFECALAESQKSVNQISDANAFLDNYGFRLSGSDWMHFEDAADESLVRVVYASYSSDKYNWRPVLEICNEYVPTLKVGERVTVIYPIRNGRTFHGGGLYPGDGKGCGPAWLTFSDGEVYVRKVENTGPLTQLDSVYYLHGNLYLTSLGLDLTKKKPYQEWLDKGILQHPIVKIGSGYWTRCNLRESINSGYMRGSQFFMREHTTDRNEYWVNVANITKGPPANIGPEVDDIYGEPLKWYFPVLADRVSLQKYIGYDPRFLMAGQLSGFEASFRGYYGPGGVDGSGKGENRYHNTGRCYLLFKDGLNSENGSALCLDENYRWKVVALDKGNNNYFPLRLFRSSYYVYDNYVDASDNYHDWWNYQ